jgi:hypothetical protein
MKSNPNHKAKNRARGLRGENIGKTEDGAVVEIVSVEFALAEPGVTLGGEKEQDDSDGKPEQASETEFVNPTPPCGATEIVYVADEPTLTVAELGEDETAKSCPAPEIGIVCGLERRLSLILIAPLALPAAVGANVTLTKQLAPTARDEPHVFVAENGAAVLIELIASARPPVLLIVTVCAVLLDPTS